MNPETAKNMPTHNLIIMRVSEQNLPVVVEKFAESFSLEIEPAEHILRSSPIVFLTGLSKEDLKILKDRLITLSKSGVEFMISTRLSPTISRVVWPGKMPNYSSTPSGELIRYVDFQWRGNAFVCPNCAETFVFKRIGNPLARYLQVKEEIPAKQSSPVPMPSKIQESSDDINESNVIELPPLSPNDIDSNNNDEIVELAPITEQPQNNSETLEPMEIIEAADLEPIDPESVPVAIPEETEQNNADIECVCSLFLTAVPPDKKSAAAELTAKIKGIPVKQAQVLLTRLLVPILKDVDQAKAATCLEEFQKIGIKGKLTVKK